MGTNRRDFLKTLGGVALFSIVPRHVLGNGYIAPSDQLTKGIIGTGGMGRGHLNYGGTRLVAVCDVDKNHLELGKNLVKEKIAAYKETREAARLEKQHEKEELERRYKELFAEKNFGFKRLMKAFPDMTSREQNESLEKYKKYFNIRKPDHKKDE